MWEIRVINTIICQSLILNRQILFTQPCMGQSLLDLCVIQQRYKRINVQVLGKVSWSNCNPSSYAY